MKKILKKEVIIAFIIGIILASSIAVYAATINAKDVDYKDGKTVEYALNELYNKKVDEYTNKTYIQTGLSTFSNRVSIIEGGYYVDENNKTWVSITFKTNQDLSGNYRWGLIKGLTDLNKQLVLTDSENRYAFLVKDFGENLGEICYFDYSGTALPKDTEITLQFNY